MRKPTPGELIQVRNAYGLAGGLPQERFADDQDAARVWLHEPHGACYHLTLFPLTESLSGVMSAVAVTEFVYGDQVKDAPAVLRADTGWPYIALKEATGVLTRVPAESRPWRGERLDSRPCEQLGRLLGKMHRTLRQFSRPLPSRPGRVKGLGAPRDLTVQVGHGPFFSADVVFSAAGPLLVGFASAELRYVAGEVIEFAWRIAGEPDLPENRVQAFLSGYLRQNPLTPSDIEAMGPLLRASLPATAAQRFQHHEAEFLVRLRSLCGIS